MGDGSLGYIRMQQLSNVPQDGFCLGEIGTVVDWGDLSKNPLDFTYRSGVDDPSNRIVDEKPSSAVSMGTARRLYENADLASFGATAPRSQTGGCEPITSIWTVECTYQGRVVAVYGYNKDIPLSVFHTLSDTDSLSDKRWFMWAPEGANMVCHLHDEISGIGVSSYRGSSIEDNALKTTNWYRQHMSEVRTRTSALVGAYRAYVKDVMDLKVPDFHHGAYAFKVGETRSEVRFDQYHMSMPNAAFKQVVAKLVATDKHMPIGFLMENVLKDVKGIKVGLVDMAYRHEENKFTYINDIRINKDDVASCLAAVTRFTETVAYNKFLRETSRTPIKLQTILRNGILLKLTRGNSGTPVELKTLSTHARLKKFSWDSVANAQTGYNAFLALGNNSNASVAARVMEFPLAVRKDYRKPAFVTFLGKERQLTSDLDTFINFCRNSYGGSHLCIKFESSTRPSGAPTCNIDFTLVERLFKLDRYFVDKDRVIPGHVYVYRKEEYNTKCYHIADSVEAWQFFADLMPTISADFKSNIDEKLEGVVQSLDLLENVIKRYGIEEHKDSQGRVDFFLVTGESGSIYKVNLAGGVYRYKMSYDTEVTKNDEYICIDPAAGHGHSSDLGFNYTISVMMALTNDSVVAPSIYTLADRLRQGRR